MLKKLKDNLGKLWKKDDKKDGKIEESEMIKDIVIYNSKRKNSVSTSDSNNINKENTFSSVSNNDVKNDDIDKSVGKINGNTIDSNSYNADANKNTIVTRREPNIFEFPKPKVLKSVSVTFILLENNIELIESLNKIKSIISKMLSKYSDMLFLPIKYGKATEDFGFINGSENYNIELLENFLLLSNDTEFVTLAEAMFLVTEYVKDINDKVKEFFKDKKDEKYQVKGINIIGIGTGKFYYNNIEKNMIIDELEELTDKYSVNSKYYCIKDEQSVNAAVLGFNLIGHINNNFYN